MYVFLSSEILAHKMMTLFVYANWSFQSLLFVTEDRICERELKGMKKICCISEGNIERAEVTLCLRDKPSDLMDSLYICCLCC